VKCCACILTFPKNLMPPSSGHMKFGEIKLLSLWMKQGPPKCCFPSMRLQCVTIQKAVNLHYHQDKFISCTYYYSLIMTVVSHCRTINYTPQKMDLKQLTPLTAILLFFAHHFNFQHGNHISKTGSSSVSSCKRYADNSTLFEP
jgi:hypothetical protein